MTTDKATIIIIEYKNTNSRKIKTITTDDLLRENICKSGIEIYKQNKLQNINWNNVKSIKANINLHDLTKFALTYKLSIKVQNTENNNWKQFKYQNNNLIYWNDCIGQWKKWKYDKHNRVVECLHWFNNYWIKWKYDDEKYITHVEYSTGKITKEKYSDKEINQTKQRKKEIKTGNKENNLTEKAR